MKLEIHQYRRTATPELGRLYVDGAEVCAVRVGEGLLVGEYSVHVDDAGHLAVMPGVALDQLVSVDLREFITVGEPHTLHIRRVG